MDAKRQQHVNATPCNCATAEVWGCYLTSMNAFGPTLLRSNTSWGGVLLDLHECLCGESSGLNDLRFKCDYLGLQCLRLPVSMHMSIHMSMHTPVHMSTLHVPTFESPSHQLLGPHRIRTRQQLASSLPATSCHHILPPHPCQSDLHLLSIGVASLGGVWLVGALRHVDLCVESGLKFSDLGLDVDERLRAKSHRATIGTNSDLGFGAVFGMSNDQLG